MKKDLVRTIGTEQTITSRQIAEVTGKAHKEVRRIIRSVMEVVKEVGGEISPSNYLDLQGKSQPQFELTIDGAMLITSKFDDVLRFKLIKHIRALESANAQPTSLPEALRAYADEVEEKERLQLELQENAPKIDFYDRVAVDTKKLYDFGEVSSLYSNAGANIGRTTLFQLLRDRNILQTQNNNHPYQRDIDNGRFELKITTLPNGKVITTPYCTEKGLKYVFECLNSFLGLNIKNK